MLLEPAGTVDVLAALDALEVDRRVPHVEAAERRRLAAHAAGAVVDGAWAPHLIDGWYLGLRRRTDGTTVGEAGRLDGGAPTAALAAAAAAGAARVWLRGADPDDVAAARTAGWCERRVLLVLGTTLADPTDPPPTPPAGLRLRPLGHVGPDAVARLLERAYAGPRRDGLVEADPDAGPWTAERVGRVAAVALADPSDLLLAVDGTGTLAGAHWTARRVGGVGEVFNLAVDPDHRGRGVAAWLLDAGLAHLAAVGCREAVLWVDERNAPARALYDRAGFAARGRDVALER